MVRVDRAASEVRGARGGSGGGRAGRCVRRPAGRLAEAGARVTGGGEQRPRRERRRLHASSPAARGAAAAGSCIECCDWGGFG